MSDVRLDVTCEATTCRPGEVLRGSVRWTALEPPRLLVAQLVWRTEGKGDQDTAVAARQEWPAPGPAGTEEFALTVPPGPLSYHGKLISVLWVLEVATERPDSLHQTEITVSPAGAPLTFPAAGEAEEGPGGLRQWLDRLNWIG